MFRGRAGLASLILFVTVFISVAVSAPLPERLSSVVERHGHDDYNKDFIARSWVTLLGREFDMADPEYIALREYLSSTLEDRKFDVELAEYTKREYDSRSIFDEQEFHGSGHTPSKHRDSDADVLHRRSFWDRIRNAFSHAGSAIRNGFHKVQATFQKAGGAIRSGFQRVGAGFQKAGSVIRNGFGKVGQGFRTAGGAMRNGFGKVGQGLRTAGGAMRNGFGKVGQGLRTAGGAIRSGLGVAATAIKDNIATAAKIGLKAYAAYATVASKIIKFVPGVGSVLSKVLKGVAMGANEGSKLIPGHLSGNLAKASEGMDYVISPMDSIGKLVGGGQAAKALEVVDGIL